MLETKTSLARQTEEVINDAAPFGRNDVSPLRTEMMLLALLTMIRCLPSCAAGNIISEAASLPKAASFARKGKHHSKSSDLEDKSLLFDGGRGWIPFSRIGSRRRRKLHITRLRTRAKARLFRCVSSP